MTRLSLICLCLLAAGCEKPSAGPSVGTAESGPFQVTMTLETGDMALYRVTLDLSTTSRVNGLTREQFRTLCEKLIAPPMNRKLKQFTFIEVRESGDPIMDQVAGYGALNLEMLLEEIDHPTSYGVRVHSVSYRLLSTDWEFAYQKKLKAIAEYEARKKQNQ